MARVNERSGDCDFGVKYFSQDGIDRPPPAVCIEVQPDMTPSEMKVVQKMYPVSK